LEQFHVVLEGIRAKTPIFAYDYLINMRIINEVRPPTLLPEAPPTKVYSCPSGTKFAQYLWRYVQKKPIFAYSQLINMHIFNEACPPAPLEKPPPTKVYFCQMWQYSRRKELGKDFNNIRLLAEYFLITIFGTWRNYWTKLFH
jgi:hypothetical protein